MSFTKDIEESVKNGLEIAEFIQNNREAIQETYGRSAIDKPSSRDRVRAWEAFIAEKNTSDPGPQGVKESRERDGDKSPQSPEMGDRDSTGEVSTPNLLISSSSGSGNNSPRYDSDFDLSNQVTEIVNRSVSQDDHGGGIADGTGRGKPEDGSGNHHGDSKLHPGASGDDGIPMVEISNQSVKRTIMIKETTEDDLKEMMEEVNSVTPRRVQNISEIDEFTKTIKPRPRTIKKTTDKNSVLMPLEEKQLSDNGVTQSAQKSLLNQESKNVSVDNAQKNVHTVMMETISEEMSDTSDLGTADSTAAKLDEILLNQKKILDKLVVLGEIKEEINNIKKTLTNHGIAMSTIENYIGDLMIIIPQSGEATTPTDTPVNPDLRMVIGRDHTRGKTEVLKKSGGVEKINIDEDLFVVPSLDEKYTIKSIDMKVNNASNFVPSDDQISVSILKGIVESEVGDPDVIDQLFELIDVGIQTMSVKDVHKHIRKLLDDMHYTDHRYTKI